MKRLNLLAATFLACVVFAGLSISQTPQVSIPEVGVIQGIVTREGTTTPIGDVQIVVTGSRPGAAPLTATTDSQGRFSIADVPSGSATVRASLQGYWGPSSNGSRPATVSVSVTVQNRQTVNVELSLTPSAAVAGRISDPSGRPVMNASVRLLRPVYSGGVQTLEAFNQKTTDDRGEYRIFGVPPGDYYLGVVPLPAAGARQSGGSQAIPVGTLYPGALEVTAATRIALNGGQEMTGADIRIRTAQPAKVSGRVTSSIALAPVVNTQASALGAAGTVRPGVAEVTIANRSSNGLREVIGGTVTVQANSADGTFEIPGLLPGAYDLYARIPVPAGAGWGPQSPPSVAVNSFAIGRTFVELRDDIDNVTIPINRGVDLTGRVVVDGKPAAINLRISLQSSDGSMNLIGMSGQIYAMVGRFLPLIDNEGAFTIPLVPQGGYRFDLKLGGVGASAAAAPRGAVNARGAAREAAAAAALPAAAAALPAAPPRAYIADIRQGARSIYDSSLNVDTRAQDPIEIHVRTDGGTIEGTVTTPDRKPAKSATVVLVPPEARRRNSALYRTVSTDAQGFFTMLAVPPGTYKLFAWENLQTGIYENQEFMAKHESSGKSIVVSPGSTTTELSLIR
jgi:hypothetical protein